MKQTILNLAGYLIIIGLPLLIAALFLFASNGNFITHFSLNN